VADAKRSSIGIALKTPGLKTTWGNYSRSGLGGGFKGVVLPRRQNQLPKDKKEIGGFGISRQEGGVPSQFENVGRTRAQVRPGKIKGERIVGRLRNHRLGEHRRERTGPQSTTARSGTRASEDDRQSRQGGTRGFLRAREALEKGSRQEQHAGGIGRPACR